MACGGIAVPQSGRRGSDHQGYESRRCHDLGRKLLALQWTFSSCFSTNCQIIFWSQNTPMEAPKSAERSCNLLETSFAFFLGSLQTDFFDRECAFQESDSLSGKTSFCIACRIAQLHLASRCPSLLHPGRSFWFYSSLRKFLPPDNGNNLH